MRQSLHIFKKDVRHLWFEIAVAISVIAGFTFTGARQVLWLVYPTANRIAAWTLVKFLLPLAWWTLIARVIHDEALPGDRQFWTTRPYSWKSLLGAKLLFVLAFINLPMLVADAVIVHAYGLPLRGELPGLLWSQVLLAVVFVLPIAALSALTTGFVDLIFAILVPCVVALVVTIVAPVAVLGSLLVGSDWVRSYYAFGVITVATVAILTWQYSRRRTAATRFLAVAAGILVVAGMALIPWSATFGIQSWFSKQRLDLSAVHVDFDSGNKWLAHAVVGRNDHVSLTLPLQINGLPPGMSAKVEGLAVSFQTTDGTTWWEDQRPMLSRSEMGQKFSLHATVDGSFYRKVKDEPLRVNGTLYLTLLGNQQMARVSFGGDPVLVPRVGACSASGGASGQPYFLICYSAFRYPSVLVSYRFLQVAKDHIQEVQASTQARPISYSPFPAEPGIGPMSQDFTFSYDHEPLSEATVDTLEPQAYIRRHFEIKDLRLSDFEAQPEPISP